MTKPATAAKTRRLSMTAVNILASLKERKTKTRRIMRPQPGPDNRIPYPGKPKLVINVRDPKLCELSPYGKVGDPIVLTESWRPKSCGISSATIEYRADGVTMERDYGDRFAVEKIRKALAHGNWMPPMFMQAWASRAPAIVKSIGVETVQEISEEDAIAEGVSPHWEGEETDCECFALERPAACNFMMLWDEINGDRPGCAWVDDPTVWCVEYELTV